MDHFHDQTTLFYIYTVVFLIKPLSVYACTPLSMLHTLIAQQNATANCVCMCVSKYVCGYSAAAFDCSRYWQSDAFVRGAKCTVVDKEKPKETSPLNSCLCVCVCAHVAPQ